MLCTSTLRKVFFLNRYRSHQITKHGRQDIQLEGSLDSTHLVAQPVGAGDLGSPAYVMPRLDVTASQPEVHNAFRSRSRNSGTGRSYDEMSGNISRGRQRLQNMFASFQERLTRRRRNIDAAYHERESQRRESMREVETLGRRLDSVSSNLMLLLDNMSRDSQRYRRYIREIPAIPDMPSIQLPNHIPNSSRQLREQIAAANQNATISRGRSHATSTPNQNSQQQPLVTDLSNQNVIGSGSSRSRNFVPTRSRGRQPNYGDIYHSTNLVTERRSNGPPLIPSLNTPRLSRNRTGNGGTSRLTERSRESNLRLSVPNAHHADRQKFSTRL